MAKALVLACLAVCVASAVAELCPLRSTYNGCLKNGCLSLASTGRRPATQVCDQCGEGYVLVGKGTRLAKCQCAPGYAGRGNQGICRACPEGTQVAPGGPVTRSYCLSCPEGTTPSEDGTTCLCPAGTYHTLGPNTPHQLGVSCKACSQFNMYMDVEAHSADACKTCPLGRVSNKDHTACVASDDPTAVALPSLIGAGGNAPAGAPAAANNSRNPFAGIQQGLQQALANARMRAEEAAAERIDRAEQRAADSGGMSGPLGLIARGIENLGGGGEPAAGISSVTDTEGDSSAPKKKFSLGSVLKKLGNLQDALDPATLMGANKLDPRALADAGLPASTSSGNLLANVMQSTIGDLDTSDWNTGI